MTTHRLVAEINVELVDPTWTERDLIDNFVDYLEALLMRGDREHSDSPSPYRCPDSDASVWISREQYLSDLEEGLV